MIYKINFSVRPSLFLLMALLLFNIQKTSAQPTVRDAFTLPSTLYTNSDRRDWVLDMDMSSDCNSVYFCGYSSPGPNSHSTKGHASVAKLDPIFKQILWEKECNIATFIPLPLVKTETPHIPNLSWSAFENVTEVGDDIVVIGTESYVTEYEWNETLQKWVGKSGKRHALYARLDANGNFLDGPRYFDMDPNEENGRGNAILGLSDGSSIIAGVAFTDGSDPSKRNAEIVKLDAYGNRDNSFSYSGPAGGYIENIIEITGHSTINFVAIGTITTGTGTNTNSEVFIEAINSTGGSVWTKEFGDNLPDNVTYDDENESNENLNYCMQSSTNMTNANSNNELGYDIILHNGELFFTAKFDYFDNTTDYGSCNSSYYSEYDLVFGKMNLNDGVVSSLENLDRMGGEDFKSRITFTNGNFFIPGLRLTNDDPTTFTDIVVMADEDGRLVGSKVTQEGDEVGCPFAIITDCDGNILIGGDKDVSDNPHNDDYYFVKLIFPCQNTVTYSGNDVTSNVSISNSITWSTSRKVKATITIENGGVLTIDDEAIIQFASAWEIVDFNELAKNNSSTVVPRIIVMPGGTLIIDHATLKGLYACDKDWMWEGIELRNGGIVTLTNEAQILDAKIGILVDQGSYNENGNFNPTNAGGGGVVSSSGDSKFINCRKGVQFAPASNPNVSTFSNTHFLCTDGLKDEQYKFLYINNSVNSIIQLGTKEFASMYDIRGISFSSCEFANTRAFSFPAELRGTGISSFDAQYSISSSTTFDDLNIGVQGLGAANPTRFIRITGDNEFNKNQIGIRLVGGNLHQIKSGNVFKLNPSSFVTNQFFGYNPILGVSNSGSTKIVVKENTFDGISSFSTSDPLKFGFISDNTNSAGFHLSNNFTKLFMGEQMQRDNTRMQLYCNEHSLFKNSWSAFGKMSSQGYCGANQSQKLTPDDKFNVPCVSNTFSHINSSAEFTYFEKSGYAGNPNPDCVTTSTVTIDDNNCNGSEPTGCEFTPPEITGGNVTSFRTQVDGMDEGFNKDVIVNELLRYYYQHNQTEDAESLLAELSGDNYKLDYALLLANSGNYTQADSVIDHISSNSDEKSDLQTFISVIINAKQGNISLDKLPTSLVNSLLSIAENRTLGAYAAQAILLSYYEKEYLLPIETSTGVGFRSKTKITAGVNDEGSLTFIPGVVEDQLNVEVHLTNPTENEVLNIYAMDGKKLYSIELKFNKSRIMLKTSDWPSGMFYGVITNGEKIILTNRAIKK